MAEKPEQTTEAYDKWVADQAAKEENGSSEPQPESEDDRINRAVQAALAKERERVAAAAPQSQVPNHGGGIGVDNHEDSWGQYDQELANRGEHPLQNS